MAQWRTKVIDGKEVKVICEICPICEEYQERICDPKTHKPGEYIVGHDCGH